MVCVVLKVGLAIDFDGSFTVMRITIAVTEFNNGIGMLMLPAARARKRRGGKDKGHQRGAINNQTNAADQMEEASNQLGSPKA